MHKKIITNVPSVFYDGNNLDFFIALFQAILKTIGECCDKAKLIALSGEGNRFCWTDEMWAFGNELTESINEIPFETEKRILSAIGWKAEYITVQYDKAGRFINTDAAIIRRDFVSAIDKGLPVLIRYVEHADCDLNIFFGYENDGQKIIGYDYNKGLQAGVSQIYDVGEMAFGSWEHTIAGYILLKEKDTVTRERDAALSVFRFNSEHARKTAEIRGRKVGFSAWESFLQHLEYDDFSGLSFESVKNRFFIYCDALCQINARKTAIPYYRYLTEHFPEWKDSLNTAIQALNDCASYGGYLWKWGFSFDKEGIEKFRLSRARKDLADAGRKAMYHDMLAIEQFEKILKLYNYT